MLIGYQEWSCTAEASDWVMPVGATQTAPEYEAGLVWNSLFHHSFMQHSVICGQLQN